MERVPAVERIRFCNSGSEAVMLALKAARAFTGRARIAKIEGAYHGLYDYAQVSEGRPPRLGTRRPAGQRASSRVAPAARRRTWW